MLQFHMPLNIQKSPRAAWAYAVRRSLLQPSELCFSSSGRFFCKIFGFPGGAQGLLQAFIFFSELYMFRLSKKEAASVRTKESIARRFFALPPVFRVAEDDAAP